ncbi:MAG: phospholipid carrier-dependent glycosyltransferase, partial [Candidatus Levybacteria bacterium]|nr:phospholipid carrier-dependent glycosyltransferase [Candidatus Levybacteria bacterium]
MKSRQDYFLNWWQASLLVFLVAMAVRMATLNQMGKTWDEPAYVETGYRYIQLASKLNFHDPFWYIQSDHPPLIRYVYGLAAVLDIKGVDKNGNTEFFYNYTYPRLISVILGSLSAVFVVLIGFRYFSAHIGFSAGLIFALIPFFIGLSQLATLESFIMFFFAGAIFFYLKLVHLSKLRYAFLCGIFCGLSMLVKQ